MQNYVLAKISVFKLDTSILVLQSAELDPCLVKNRQVNFKCKFVISLRVSDIKGMLNRKFSFKGNEIKTSQL